MSQNQRRAAPVIDPKKKSLLFEVPYRLSKTGCSEWMRSIPSFSRSEMSAADDQH
jgi:hypothetical protein